MAHGSWLMARDPPPSQLRILHRLIPPRRPRPALPEPLRLPARSIEPVQFPSGRQRDCANESVDDSGRPVRVAHDVALVEVSDEPGGSVDRGDEEVLAQAASDGDDAAHRGLGGGEIGTIVLEGTGQWLFSDEVAAIGGNPRQLRRVPAPAIEDDEFIEHVTPAGVGDFDFESPGSGLKAQLFPHRPAGPQIEEFVDDTAFLIEKRTRLGPGWQWLEQVVCQKSILVPEAEGLEINQRDSLFSESSGESVSPNIN